MPSQSRMRRSADDEAIEDDQGYEEVEGDVGNSELLERLGLSRFNREADGDDPLGGASAANHFPVGAAPAPPGAVPMPPGGAPGPFLGPKLPFPNGPTGLGPAPGVVADAPVVAGEAAGEAMTKEVGPRLLKLGLRGGAAAAGFALGVFGPALLGAFLDHADEVDQRPDPDLRSLPGGAPPQTGDGPSADAGAPLQAPPQTTGDKATDGQPEGAPPLEAAPKDKWYGYNDKKFQQWFHRCRKKPGDPDASKDEIEDAWQEWNDAGRPSSDNC